MKRRRRAREQEAMAYVARAWCRVVEAYQCVGEASQEGEPFEELVEPTRRDNENSSSLVPKERRIR